MPPPGTPEFDQRVTGWLFDLCPPRYRDHAVLRRRPAVLAWLAERHIESQVTVVADAAAAARSELAGTVEPGAVEAALEALGAERALLAADLRAVRLVAHAVAGGRFVDRL